MTMSDSQANLLSLIVPIYQDAECVPSFLARLHPILQQIQTKFGLQNEIIFVMDPSGDETEKVILQAREENPAIKLIIMSRRFGQQPAILTGLFECRGEAAVVVDVDLQDPPEAILDMVAKYKEGYNVVNGLRTRRPDGEHWLRGVLVERGYWLMNKIATVNIPRNVGDFRLVDRRIIEELRKLKETHGFFRGLVPFVGFRQTEVPFERQERHAGASKYPPLWGSLHNSMNALVCFSNQLLSLAGVMGVVFIFLLLIILYYLIYVKFFSGTEISTGFFLLTMVLLIIAAIQAFLVAVLGAYIGRIYDEVRQRPIAIIDKKIGW